MAGRRRSETGFTTGTCAQAAARAAMICLFSGKEVKEVTVTLPGGKQVSLPVELTRRDTAGALETGQAGSVTCAVRKYSGDDPDITNGILVYATVTAVREKRFTIDGGIGVGRVTKPGLDQPVGAAAINRVPRQMLRQTVQEVCRAYDWSYGIDTVISMPEGVELARRTFNPRLGIEGGLSVLGTTGIVEPMSEKALVDTIQVEINVKRAAGELYLLAAPGNYGLDFLNTQYEIPESRAVKCSNYVGDTIDMARNSGAKGILFVAHIGKFIKVAGGIMNTHSRYADARMEITAGAMLRAGLDPDKARRVLDCITMDDALALLSEEEREKLMREVLERIHAYLNLRAEEGMMAGAIVFSGTYGCLGRTAYADELLEQIQREQHAAGTLSGVGVGPGDPELMTGKALRVIRECEVLAVPGRIPKETVAYQIARGALKEVEEKELLGLHLPMTKDASVLAESHKKAAEEIKKILDTGKNVAFLTLGDPCIYSTFAYVQKPLQEAGYETKIINGIPSFLAVSARLNEVLTEGAQMLHVIPATYQVEEGMKLDGTRVLMKCGKKLPEIGRILKEKEDLTGKLVERCGMEGEQIYENPEEFPEESGYYSLMIVKEEQA